MTRSIAQCVLKIGIILFVVTSAAKAQSVMTHHVREVVRHGTAHAIGRMPSNQILELDLVLPLRDPEGLKSFLSEAYNPSSPNYRHFLTPSEFTTRFGPTQDQYDAVLNFAKTYGLDVVGGSRDGLDVQVKGSVGAIETALHIDLGTYQHPSEDRIFYSPDREPSLDLGFNLWHISGLDNYSIPKPLLVGRDAYAQAHGIAPEDVVKHATTGSGPSASFLGSDMRAAYYGTGALTGAGQNLGLLEYLGTDLTDLNTYYTNANQTNNVSITLLSTDGTSTNCVYSRGHCDDTEQTLDMTQALGMAPGLASLTMYVGSTDTAILSAMTTHIPLPTTIGCSWGWTPADPSTLDPYFQRMAAQGQNFFAASGDYSTWTASGNSQAWPADDAYVVSVGGTDLTTDSTSGGWASETAWADSGGGISPDGIAIPSWQQLAGVINSSNNGSTTLRNGPDVSANANFTFYVCADQKGCTANLWGGTSFAAPMWAGYIALVNEKLAGNGKPTIGFLNPTIYNQNVTSSYASDFHDITTGTSGSYSAVAGFDLVTGWGSPNTGLIDALAGGSATAGFSLSASPSSVSVVAGSSNTTTIALTVSGTYSSAVSFSASGLPTGVTASFSPTSLSGNGSTTLTFTATANASTGTSTVTVTGKGLDGTVESTTVSLTVTAAPSDFSIAANPTSLSVKRGSSTQDTITAIVTLGSISSVSLSASATGHGVSVGFTPATLSPGTGSASSTMTVSANRKATTGTFNLVVTAAGGGNSHTVTIPLTVN